MSLSAILRQPGKTLLTFCLILTGLLTIFGVQPMAASTHENWTVRCDKPDPKKKSSTPYCEVFQRLTLQKTGQRIAEFAVGFPGKNHDTASGVLILPLGIVLNEDVHMKIDNKAPQAFRVRYCTDQGCFAFLNLNKSLLTILRDGKKLQITGQVFNGQPLSIILDLNGFDRAVGKL